MSAVFKFQLAIATAKPHRDKHEGGVVNEN